MQATDKQTIEIN